VLTVGPVGTVDGFGTEMTRLDESLRAHGWQTAPGDALTMDVVLDQYWTRMAGTPGASPNGDGQYTPSDLPGIRYVRPGPDGAERALAVSWVDRSTAALALRDYNQPTFERDGRTVTEAEVLTQVPAGSYGIALEVGWDYFVE
jgi:hypothetical protein